MKRRLFTISILVFGILFCGCSSKDDKSEKDSSKNSEPVVIIQDMQDTSVAPEVSASESVSNDNSIPVVNTVSDSYLHYELITKDAGEIYDVSLDSNTRGLSVYRGIEINGQIDTKFGSTTLDDAVMTDMVMLFDGIANATPDERETLTKYLLSSDERFNYTQQDLLDGLLGSLVWSYANSDFSAGEHYMGVLMSAMSSLTREEINVPVISDDENTVSDITTLLPKHCNIMISASVSPKDQTEDGYAFNVDYFFVDNDTREIVYIQGIETVDNVNSFVRKENVLTDEQYVTFVKEFSSRVKAVRDLGDAWYKSPYISDKWTGFTANEFLMVEDTDYLNELRGLVL